MHGRRAGRNPITLSILRVRLVSISKVVWVGSAGAVGWLTHVNWTTTIWRLAKNRPFGYWTAGRILTRRSFLQAAQTYNWTSIPFLEFQARTKLNYGSTLSVSAIFVRKIWIITVYQENSYHVKRYVQRYTPECGESRQMSPWTGRGWFVSIFWQVTRLRSLLYHTQKVTKVRWSV